MFARNSAQMLTRWSRDRRRHVAPAEITSSFLRVRVVYDPKADNTQENDIAAQNKGLFRTDHQFEKAMKG